MADIFLYACVGIGFAALLMGYRAAFVLIGALVVNVAIMAAGVPFALWLWLAIDMAALAFLIQPVMSLPEKLIAGLYPVAGAAYLVPDPAGYWGAYAVVCVQFLLCAPFLWTQRGRWQVSHGPLREIKHGAR